jgi:hypothetical protein
LTIARLYLNSLTEAPKNWGQIDPNHNDYHSDPIDIRSTFWLPNITDWWHQHDETHSKYTDFSNVAPKKVSIIPQGVGMEASFSLGCDVVRWRQSNITGNTLCEKVLVSQYAHANNRILASDDAVFDTTEAENDIELKRKVEERKWHRMAKVNHFLEMWQGS